LLHDETHLTKNSRRIIHLSIY